MRRGLFAFIFLLCFSQHQAHAGLWGEFSGFYNSDSFAQSSETTTQTRMLISGTALANLDNKSRFYGGFQVFSVNQTDSATGTSATYASLDMGPMLMWVIDQKGIYSVTAGYNVIAKSTYSDGTGTTQEWTGTSLSASFGIMPELGDDFYLGFRLNYYAPSYSKQVVSGAATDVTVTRAWIYPSFCLSWRH